MPRGQSQNFVTMDSVKAVALLLHGVIIQAFRDSLLMAGSGHAELLTEAGLATSGKFSVTRDTTERYGLS